MAAQVKGIYVITGGKVNMDEKKGSRSAFDAKRFHILNRIDKIDRVRSHAVCSQCGVRPVSVDGGTVCAPLCAARRHSRQQWLFGGLAGPDSRQE
jgi:hypothetical protein